jgi:Alkylmercury lyase
MTDSDLGIRMAVYRYFAENRRSPALEEMCDIAGQSSDAIQDAYQRLYARRMLVPCSDGRSIRMAPPFSGVETQHRVHVRERQYYGNCAWDAFGVIAALGRYGRVESRCEETAEPLILSLRPSGPSESSWRFHVVVPTAQWWKDIVFT